MRVASLSLLLVLPLGPAARAQTPADADALKTTLVKLEKDSWEAMKRQDAGFFKSYMADDFVGVFADGLAVTKKDFVQTLADLKLTGYEMSDARLLPVGPDATFVLYRLKYEGTFRGEKVRVRDAHASSLYVRRGGRWLELFYQETEATKK